jgi:UDP-N-acetylmuramyl pentapeptide phosphotransferase/UDP-N-acetylglucosamine-1-phosphate transferase
MDNILLSAALAFLITFFAIPVIIQIAKSKKLFDEPDERKVHKTVIPTLGGLGIFAGFIVAVLLGVPSTNNPEFQYFVAAAIVIFFLGIKDDIMILSASKKFIGQLIAAAIIIHFGGIQIAICTALGYIRAAGSRIVLSFFTIIVITNSFNLIDGVDGLAGTLGLITTIALGTYFLVVGQTAYAVLAFSLTGSIIGFLIYNFSPAKIFMGDTGSLLLGLINSILVIKFINLAATPGSHLPIQASPAVGFAIMIIPLFDTLRVFGLRILDRRSPFSPDRNHIHHYLLDLGFSHKKITFTCALVTIIFIAFAFYFRNADTTLMIGTILAVSTGLTALIYYSRRKIISRKTYMPVAGEKEIIKSHKILTLISDTVEVD